MGVATTLPELSEWTLLIFGKLLNRFCNLIEKSKILLIREKVKSNRYHLNLILSNYGIRFLIR